MTVKMVVEAVEIILDKTDVFGEVKCSSNKTVVVFKIVVV